MNKTEDRRLKTEDLFGEIRSIVCGLWSDSKGLDLILRRPLSLSAKNLGGRKEVD